MNVVQLAPLVSPIVDPGVGLEGDQIGGAQTYLADLATGLAELGHRVTLLAAPGSRVAMAEVVELPIAHLRLVPARFDGQTPRTDLDAQDAAFVLARAWLDEHCERVEVVHAHAFDAPAFDRLIGYPSAVVHTLHLPPVDEGVAAAALRSSRAGAVLSTNSDANAAAWRAAGVPVDEVVPYGLDVASLPFGPRGGGYLLFVGRLTPEKGPDVAIEAAGRDGRPLVLVGGVYDRGFYDRVIRPRVHERPDWRPGGPLDPGATYVGARPRAGAIAAMAGADALLMPVRWDEPLGLVAVEAAAAGCPVVAFARGGLAEVVVDGVTGWRVPADDLTALDAALARVHMIDRAACRTSAEARFGAAAMARGYLALYGRASAIAGD